MKTQLLVSLSLIICTVQAWESWMRVQGTKFEFDLLFRNNLREQKDLKNNSEKKKQLMDFL